MEFLQSNAGTIIVGIIVFGILGALTARLIVNFRKGKSSCGCGCSACKKSKPA